MLNLCQSDPDPGGWLELRPDDMSPLYNKTYTALTDPALETSLAKNMGIANGKNISRKVNCFGTTANNVETKIQDVGVTDADQQPLILERLRQQISTNRAGSGLDNLEAALQAPIMYSSLSDEDGAAPCPMSPIYCFAKEEMPSEQQEFFLCFTEARFPGFPGFPGCFSINSLYGFEQAPKAEQTTHVQTWRHQSGFADSQLHSSTHHMQYRSPVKCLITTCKFECMAFVREDDANRNHISSANQDAPISTHQHPEGRSTSGTPSIDGDGTTDVLDQMGKSDSTTGLCMSGVHVAGDPAIDIKENAAAARCPGQNQLDALNACLLFLFSFHTALLPARALAWMCLTLIMVRKQVVSNKFQKINTTWQLDR